MNRETSTCIICKSIIPFGLLYCQNCLPQEDSMLESLGYEL